MQYDRRKLSRRFIRRVKRFVTDVLTKARNNLIEWILGSLGLMLSTSWPAVKGRILGLSLSNTEVLTIRLSLACAGLILISSIGWPLYFRLRKQHRHAEIEIKKLETKLTYSLTHPPKLSDDYTFLPDRGYWVHKITGERICANCLAENRISPLAATISIITPMLASAIGEPRVIGNWPVWKCVYKGCGQISQRRNGDT